MSRLQDVINILTFCLFVLLFLIYFFLLSMNMYIVVPHITDAIQDWVTKVSGEPVEKTTKADVCLIEVSISIAKILLFPNSF